jgi:uncharacterized delta-60 repeat protein
MTFTPDANFNGSVSLSVTSTLAADLVGQYTFEGGTAKDQAAGVAHNGTLNGNATTITDATRGEVLTLDGDDDFVRITGLLGEPASVTVSGWINATGLDAFGSVILSMGESPALYLTATGNLEAYYESGGTSNVFTGNENLVGTGWRHVAVTIDDTTRQMSVYLDGQLIGLMTGNGPIEYDNSPDTFIGRAGDGLGDFDFIGQVDDARIHTRPLTADEVKALANDLPIDANVVTINVDAVNDVPVFGSPVAGVGINRSDSSDTQQSGVAILSDGSQVVVGTINNDLVLTRFNADGSVDETFGVDGKVTSGFSSENDNGYAIDVDTSDRLYVAGRLFNGSDFDAIVMRFNATGTLDTTFANAGVYTYDSGGGDRFDAIKVQSDGSILAAGSNNVDALVVRLDASGALDNTFDADGIATFDFEGGGTTEEIRDIELQSDGQIIIGGEFQDTPYESGFVARLTTAGVLDTTFGGTGVVATTFGLTDDIRGITDILVQADDKIVIAGAEAVWWHWGMTRFNSDGSLDTGFDSDGHVVESFGGDWGNIAGVEQQSDGKLVVAGYISLPVKGQSDWVVARYNTDGTMDGTFGDDGFSIPFVGYFWNEIYAMDIAPDDSFVVAGYTSFSSSTSVGYFNADGSLDTTRQSNVLDGNPTFVEGGSPVVLDTDVEIFDVELSAADNFDNAFLWISRSGGGNVEDVFRATGNLDPFVQGNDIMLSGVNIGTVSSTASGNLILTFNASATQERVNETLQSIAYENTSNTPPATVDIEWEFNDGNAGAQGSGGALTATGNTLVNIRNTVDLAITAPTGTRRLFIRVQTSFKSMMALWTTHQFEWNSVLPTVLCCWRVPQTLRS